MIRTDMLLWCEDDFWNFDVSDSNIDLLRTIKNTFRLRQNVFQMTAWYTESNFNHFRNWEY